VHFHDNNRSSGREREGERERERERRGASYLKVQVEGSFSEIDKFPLETINNG
jgi:hypothetical protein